MRKHNAGWLAVFAVLSGAATAAPAPTVVTVAAGSLPRIGSVSDRFLSYNIEMVELTGGRFWRPYASSATDRYEYRPPVDLAEPKLRAFAAALAPAYVRFSGTWANATWFADDKPVPTKPPAGFDSVLTQAEWAGAVAFARAANARIVTSVATSPGARDAAGVWHPDEAARWFAYSRRIGGPIAASEFANEPNFIALTKPPAGYTAADYRRDYAIFAHWLRRASPDTLLLAPGIAEMGEPARSASRRNKAMTVYDGEDLLESTSPPPDAFTFHFYPGASVRCGGGMLGVSLANALAPQWLDAIDPAIARIAALRDRFAPGAPLWNTESGETACGGDPWASSFADVFRFVDTLGRSARQGVQVFINNTLAASDYGMLDEHTHDPRPDYWAALLWHRMMGTGVLAAPATGSPGLRLYAHCLRGAPGGVALAAVNVGDAALTLHYAGAGDVWLLSSPVLDGQAMTVNGAIPALASNGRFTGLAPTRAAAGFSLPARSIAFVALAAAHNPACR